MNNFNLLENCALASFTRTEQEQLDVVAGFLLVCFKSGCDAAIHGLIVTDRLATTPSKAAAKETWLLWWMALGPIAAKRHW